MYNTEKNEEFKNLVGKKVLVLPSCENWPGIRGKVGKCVEVSEKVVDYPVRLKFDISIHKRLTKGCYKRFAENSMVGGHVFCVRGKDVKEQKPQYFKKGGIK